MGPLVKSRRKPSIQLPKEAVACHKYLLVGVMILLLMRILQMMVCLVVLWEVPMGGVDVSGKFVFFVGRGREGMERDGEMVIASL
jgi:hypothetical protein